MFTKKRVLIIVFVVVILLVSFGYFVSQNGILVDTEIVKKGDVVKSVEETGTINTKENNIIYSKTTGQVSAVMFEVGDTVKKGDILIKIDKKELELKAKGIKAQIDSVNFEYKETLDGADAEDINQMLLKIDTARTSYFDYKRIYDNNLDLYKNGAVSENELKSSESNLNISSDNLNSAVEELKSLKKGVSENIQGKYLKQIESLEYELESVNNAINNCEIIAPSDFTVLEKDINVGEMVSVGSPILNYLNGDIIVNVDILASESRNVKVGTKTFITDDDNQFKYEGVVTKVYPSAFSKLSDLGIEQKRVKVEVSFKEIHNFAIGYDIDVEFITEEKNGVLKANDRSIFEKNGKHYIFVIENNIARLTEVEIGLEGNDYLEIKKGIKENDVVILSPSNEVEDGIKVIEK